MRNLRPNPRRTPDELCRGIPGPVCKYGTRSSGYSCCDSSDQCIIDQQWFFIRGCLDIPILGSDEPFLWGLWVSVREEVFDQIEDCWEVQGREQCRGPFKGRLANSLAE